MKEIETFFLCKECGKIIATYRTERHHWSIIDCDPIWREIEGQAEQDINIVIKTYGRNISHCEV